jgi:hypothetical protein
MVCAALHRVAAVATGRGGYGPRWLRAEVATGRGGYGPRWLRAARDGTGDEAAKAIPHSFFVRLMLR